MTQIKQLDMRITNLCQLNCKHCYLSPDQRNTTPMDIDLFISVVNSFFTMPHPVKETRIVLSGGEPLMHPLFPKFVDLLRSINQRVRISSNGILIPKFIDLFEPNDGIQISIDGDKEVHDSIRGAGVYNQAVTSLKLLHKKGIHHSVYMVLCEENIHCVDNVARLCEATNSKFSIELLQPFNHVTVTPVSFKTWLDTVHLSRSLYPNIYSPGSCVIQGCDARILSLTVLPDGTYWDCARSQRVIGKYPTPIKDVMLWDYINSHETLDPFTTCCRNIK